jgi:hypothetical protein
MLQWELHYKKESGPNTHTDGSNRPLLVISGTSDVCPAASSLPPTTWGGMTQRLRADV